MRLLDAFNGVLHDIYQRLPKEDGVEMNRNCLVGELQVQMHVSCQAEVFDERAARLHLLTEVA